jgi:CLIP-associating protein 1/2
MSQLLGSKFDHFAESQMAHLINLIPNSAKIMATSGIVCIRFILQVNYFFSTSESASTFVM